MLIGEKDQTQWLQTPVYGKDQGLVPSLMFFLVLLPVPPTDKRVIVVLM